MLVTHGTVESLQVGWLVGGWVGGGGGGSSRGCMPGRAGFEIFDMKF